MIQKRNTKEIKSIRLVFPNQLFEEHPALDSDRVVYQVEEPLFFKQYKFHKKTRFPSLFNEILSALS